MKKYARATCRTQKYTEYFKDLSKLKHIWIVIMSIIKEGLILKNVN